MADTKNAFNLQMSLIYSLIGGILLLIGDFGGYSTREYWYNDGVTTYYTYPSYYIHLTSDPLAGLTIGLVSAGMFYVAYQSNKARQNEGSNDIIERIFTMSVGITILVVIIALILIQQAENDGTLTEWWLSEGFYGSFFGSLISAVFLKGVKE